MAAEVDAACVDCPTYQASLKFVEELVFKGREELWSALHNPAFDKCYCATQTRYDGRLSSMKGGVRFGLHFCRNRAAARSIFEWEKVYHGTKAKFLPDIVELGYLLKVGDETPTGQVIGERDDEQIMCGDGVFKREALRGGGGNTVQGVEAFVPKSNVFVTPSFIYAAHEVYATKTNFGPYQFKLILEFRIKPDTFDKGPQTVRRDMFVSDPKTPNDEFEYYTKRHGAMMLTGLHVVAAGEWTLGLIPRGGPPSCSRVANPVFGMSSPSITTTLRDMHARCPNAALRWKLIQHLGINPAYFNHQFDRCYCGCERLPDKVSEGPVGNKRHYVLPKPMTRFAMHVDGPRTELSGTFEYWHTCYHGTTLAAVKPIIETGYLIYPGSTDIHGRLLGIRSHNGPMFAGRTAPKGMPTKTICMSPSIKYASHEVYASRHHLGDSNFYVVLQFKTQPLSYTTFQSTLEESITDAYVPENAMEWHTRRHGTLVLYGVLVGHEPALVRL